MDRSVFDYHYFISHAGEDAGRAAKLHDELSGYGITSVVSGLQYGSAQMIRSDGNWPTMMASTARRSRRMIGLVSHHANKPGCFMEEELAMFLDTHGNDRKLILAVRIEQIEADALSNAILPYFHGKKQRLDFFPDDSDSAAACVRTLAEVALEEPLHIASTSDFDRLAQVQTRVARERQNGLTRMRAPLGGTMLDLVLVPFDGQWFYLSQQPFGADKLARHGVETAAVAHPPDQSITARDLEQVEAQLSGTEWVIPTRDQLDYALCPEGLKFLPARHPFGLLRQRTLDAFWAVDGDRPVILRADGRRLEGDRALLFLVRC